MDFKQWLSEMPLGIGAAVGKGWKDFPAGKKRDQHWDKASYNIIKGDAAKDFKKLRKSFKLVDQTIDAYFVKSSGMRDNNERGEVDEEFLPSLGIDPPKINRSNITVFFVGNVGDYLIPLTPWTIAHRLGHALRRLPSYQTFIAHVERDFKQLMELIYHLEKPSQWDSSEQGYKKTVDYDRFTKQLMMSLGTMRSAREKKLARSGEFSHELFAQAIIQNKIEFKKEIPKQIIIDYMYGSPRWDSSKYSRIHDDEPMLDYAVQLLESNANFYKTQVNRILAEAVGKIFVM